MADIANPIKKVPKGTWVIALVAGGGVALYVWWKKKNTPPVTTGYGANYGYGASYGYGVSPIFGYGQGGFPAMPGPYGYGGYPQNPAPTTNAQWFQAAVAWMTQGGASFSAVEAALGKYLAGAPVTSDQALLIQEAEGAMGPPPVSGPNGFPPNINTASPGPGGHAQNPVTGLHQTQVGVTGADISWKASSGATSYKVTASKGNPEVTGPTSARIHSINSTHPKDRGDQSTVTVLAEPASQNARPARIVVHTKR